MIGPYILKTADGKYALQVAPDAARPATARIFGYPATSVADWMGANGWTFDDAKRVFAAYSVGVTDSTIRTGLFDGENPKYANPAPLTDEQGAELKRLRRRQTSEGG
jgi:hypothetical protein